MKGILYGNFLLNRKWFLAAGITAVLSTAACAVLITVFSKTPEIISLAGTVFILAVVVVLALCEEWLGRNLEHNIKCRFTDITLAGGISKNTFVLSELLKNVITMVIGLAMCLAMTGVISIFDNSFWSVGQIKFLVSATILIGAVDWIIIPLVIKFKSAEKAGIVVGLVFGFGIVCPLVFAFKTMDNGKDIFTMLIGLFDKAWFFPALLSACAAIYVIFYAIILHRVKWGDVC